MHIHIDAFHRSSIGQMKNGYEACQGKNNIYSNR